MTHAICSSASRATTSVWRPRSNNAWTQAKRTLRFSAVVGTRGNKAPPGTFAVIGFRAHTGWAAAIAVTPQWRIIERCRITYEPEPTRFIYHHASEIAPDMAEALIETARAQAVEKARREIEN